MKNNGYLVQIDLLKAFAIISVITIHSFPSEIIILIFGGLHILQAVPIFMILLGFNLTSSLSGHRPNIKRYFLARFYRIFIPFLIMYLISTLIGYFYFDLTFNLMTLFGYFPFPGPGNYFIALLLQSIIIFPFIHLAYNESPVITLTLIFIFDLFFQIVSPRLEIFQTNHSLYYISVFRYIFALSLGIWISYGYEIGLKRNRFILFGSMLSTIYLIAITLFDFSIPYFFNGTRTENLVSSFYPILIVMLVLNYRNFKPNSSIIKTLTLIGKSSYHIFLVQIVYFGILSKLQLYRVPNMLFYNIFICVSLGIMFYLSIKSTVIALNKNSGHAFDLLFFHKKKSRDLTQPK